MRLIFAKHLRKAGAAAFAGALLATPVAAGHSWSNHHWWLGATGEVNVPVDANLTGNWPAHLQIAVEEWNKSAVIQAPAIQKGTVRPRACKPVAGRIQACNATYGRNGWLGLAQIWVADGHISQGVTKLNDTYFNMATYDTVSWRQLVTCQEIGHVYGLRHQDEDSSTDATTSCMDYTNRPRGNEYPDQHDYDQLMTIYNRTRHTSTETTASIASRLRDEASGGDTLAEWGRAIQFMRDGRPFVFEKLLPSGRKTITHVFWAIGEGPRRPHH